ncbi:NADP-dependent oxidoreductase domain-containing protein [Mycena polygramma]|nr:NADP-dependent oxidoreductase domain-containing protein [Mycena polygramma]
MAAVPTIKLNTGALIPTIGIGAAPEAFSEEAIADTERWLLTAFKAGYRHFDTAHLYRTEPQVGAALRASGLPREELFVTTKLPPFTIKMAPHKIRASLVRREFEEAGIGLCGFGSLHFTIPRRSGLMCSMKYLMHFPQSIEFQTGYDAPLTVGEMAENFKVVATPSLNDTWTELELHASGRARAIGVSNFSIKTLKQLFETAKTVPAVNQVEMHPYLAQTELLEYCRKKGIVVTAYSPSGHAQVRNDPVIVALAEKYKVSPTQIILAWHLARGVVVVPKSSNPERQKENLTLPTLSEEDVASVTVLDRNERIVNKIGPDGKLWGWTAEQYGW